MAAYVATHENGDLFCNWNTDGPAVKYVITIAERDPSEALPELPVGAAMWRRVAIVVRDGELLS